MTYPKQTNIEGGTMSLSIFNIGEKYCCVEMLLCSIIPFIKGENQLAADKVA